MNIPENTPDQPDPDHLKSAESAVTDASAQFFAAVGREAAQGAEAVLATDAAASQIPEQAAAFLEEHDLQQDVMADFVTATHDNGVVAGVENLLKQESSRQHQIALGYELSKLSRGEIDKYPKLEPREPTVDEILIAAEAARNVGDPNFAKGDDTAIRPMWDSLPPQVPLELPYSEPR